MVFLGTASSKKDVSVRHPFFPSSPTTFFRLRESREKGQTEKETLRGELDLTWDRVGYPQEEETFPSLILLHVVDSEFSLVGSRRS